MQLYISQSGGIEGPFSQEVVESMLREGKLSPSDLGGIPGDSDWKPLSELVDCSAFGEAIDSGSPPPPPRPQLKPASEAQFMIDGVIPSGTRGKTVRQITEEVQAGGRFVVYQYVVSIIIMSFRRGSPITYIPPGRSGAGAAFGWSFLSMLVGWWGIPWGIFFTIGALWRNAAGGMDVTEPILAQWIGPQNADALVRQRPKRPSGGLWVLRGLMVSPLLLIALIIFQGSLRSAAIQSGEAELPGYSSFKRADDYLQGSGVGGGGGNTNAASLSAGQFGNMLQSIRNHTISDDASTRAKNRDTKITVWCELSDERCLYLVKIPDLRHFNDDAKEFMGEAAWFSAQMSAKNLGLPDDAELVVAVRGASRYDRMIVGQFLPNFDSEALNYESTLKASIRETNRLRRKKRLIGYFGS